MFCVQEGSLNGSVKPLNDLTDQTDSGASLFLLFEQQRWAREGGANGVPCRCSSGSPLSKGRNLLLLTCWRGKWHGHSRTDPSAPSLTDLRLSGRFLSAQERGPYKLGGWMFAWAAHAESVEWNGYPQGDYLADQKGAFKHAGEELAATAAAVRGHFASCAVGEGRHDAAWAPGG
ncbi:hypothetical protein TcBrA4_0071180 [Trypanosoma cruzi]|nr:hypothetical protein TcBrA4_0071180 [Trypanosoma cruzi]